MFSQYSKLATLKTIVAQPRTANHILAVQVSYGLSIMRTLIVVLRITTVVLQGLKRGNISAAGSLSYGPMVGAFTEMQSGALFGRLPYKISM